jgi:hypothetical protein
MNRLIMICSVSVVLLLAILTGCDSAPSGAENDGRMRLSIDKGHGEFANHVVHVNAMSTASLTPEVALSYGIARSAKSGLINLVVLKKIQGQAEGQPVKAVVEVSAANLTGQAKPVDLREVVDGQSIYYLGTVSVDDRETINFDFDIVPEGEAQNLPIRFTHKFYTR